MGVSLSGATGEIPPLLYYGSNFRLGGKTVPVGQFNWGGSLLKDNGGAQRYPQTDWKPVAECKGIWMLDCEADRPSRKETWA